MTRVRFFEGQLLSAKDFADEQEYQAEKRRLHNRRLHGVGVVDGLDVTVEEGASPTAVVSPGLAIDKRGNEILVDRLMRIGIGLGGDAICFVTIEYRETLSAPVPSALPSQEIEFSRVTEGFELAIDSVDPGEIPDAPGLGLAKLVRREGCWIVDEDYKWVRTIRIGFAEQGG